MELRQLPANGLLLPFYGRVTATDTPIHQNNHLGERRIGAAMKRSYRRAEASGSGQQVPRDDHPLDLARPLPDRAELHVAVVLLRREVLDEAVAAEDLHAALGG